MIKNFRFIFVLFIIFLRFALFSSENRKEVVNKLFREVEYWMGTPYVYGGYTKSGVDCSGFTSNVYKKIFNVDLPRSVSEQKYVGKQVTDDLQPGDLVFFITIGNKVSHVGIYVFDDKFIHAASDGPQIGVIKSSLSEKYYKTRYVYARRVIDINTIKLDNDIILANNTKEIQKELNSDKENKSTIDNSKISNKEKIEDEKEVIGNLLNFNIGNVLYNDSLYRIGDIFDRERQIIFELENLLVDDKNVVLFITNNEVTKKVYIFDFKKDNKIRKKIYLQSGNWVVYVQNNKGFVYIQKEFFVM